MEYLPAEIILEILSHIPFVEYFRSMRKVCSLWRDLIDDVLLRVRTLNLPNYFNINKVIQRMAPQLKHIEAINTNKSVSLGDAYLILVLQQCCSNGLIEISLNKCQLLTDASLIALTTHATSLRSLSINECTKFTEGSLGSFMQATKSLTKLSMRKFQKLNKIVLPETLMVLNVSGCQSLSDATLLDLCFKCVNLETLILDQCGGLTGAGILTLCARLPNLKRLSVSYCKLENGFLAKLASICRRIEWIDVESCNNLKDDDFVAISKQCGQLFHLNLGDCWMITNKTFNALMENCPRLSYLQIHGCQDISQDLVVKAKQNRQIQIES